MDPWQKQWIICRTNYQNFSKRDPLHLIVHSAEPERETPSPQSPRRQNSRRLPLQKSAGIQQRQHLGYPCVRRCPRQLTGSRLTQPGYEWLRESVLGAGDQRVARVRALQPIADALGVTLAQLAIAWCLRNPHVSTVMLGASRPEQLAQNLDALEVLPRLDAAIAERMQRAVDAG